jgi:capsular polysaccharide biosynthesis protein
VELKDALQRIVRQHLLLIGGLVALGILLGALLGRHPSQYTASTRLVLGTDDPKSRTESGSIADTGKAIATGLRQVQLAIRAAHVSGRDPSKVQNHVSVRALGTSSVVQLSVSDKNPRVAQAIANALANQVIGVRNDVTSGQLDKVQNDLTSRINTLNDSIAGLDQTIDRLGLQAAGSSTARNQRDAALRQRDFLTQQRAALESERITVLSAGALRPSPKVISAASLPTHADSSSVLQESVLGALLGLVLGIGAAGLIETFRPTLVGSDSLAREFDTPLLGTIQPAQDEQLGRQTLTRIALRLRLAAESVHAQSVGLVPIGRDVELGVLAATLDELATGVTMRAAPRRVMADAGVSGRGRAVAQAEAEGIPRSGAGSSGPRVRIRPYGLLEGRADNGDMALVLVSPSVVKKEEVDEVSHLLRVAGSPVVGLITYKRPRERARFELPRLPNR